MSMFFPIPRLFHSAYSGEAFQQCLDCECELQSHETFYTVQKFVVAGETVFEMALCDGCRAQLYQRFSDESRATIQRYISEQRAESASSAAEVPPVLEIPPPSGHVTNVESLDSLHACVPHAPDSRLPTPDSVESLDSLQACVLCHTPKAQLRRYALVGLFLADEIFVMRTPPAPFPMPCLVCDACNSGLDGMLSKKTREEWNEFVEEHFPGPPGIELDSPRQTPLMV